MRARDVRPGMLVLDASTGLWCDVADVQSVGEHVWLLWGATHPPCSTGWRLAPDAEVTAELCDATHDAWEDW